MMKQSQYYPHNALWYLAGFISLYLLSATVPAVAVVSDTQITDVTTRAFSVVWVSSEQVASATVNVFSDASGSNNITATLNVIPVSDVNPSPALLQGIVKVDVTGLAPGTTAYVRTVTNGVESPNLLPVRTALESTKANSNNQPIVNDLILHKIFLPDGVNPAEGALLLVKVPKISSYPLTAFVDQGFTAPVAVIDLNNLFNDATGVSAEVLAGEVLEVTEFRGLHCDQNQKLTHMRQAPGHEEPPPVITELELPVKCFSPNNIAADFNCDKGIDPGDFNLFLSSFGTSIPTCRFNPDYDLNADETVGPGDFNLFLSVFGRKM